MAISEISVCNGALMLLGAERIMSLSQDSEEGKACLERYEHVRDAILQIQPWAFCTFRTQLVETLEPPVYDYQYRFLLPSSPYCLLVLEVYEDDDWVIEGHYLLSNSTIIHIKYIGRVTDASQFPPMVADLISARLAVELAYKLTGSTTMVGILERLYQIRLSETLSREAKIGNMPLDVSDNYRDSWFIRRTN